MKHCAGSIFPILPVKHIDTGMEIVLVASLPLCVLAKTSNDAVFPNMLMLMLMLLPHKQKLKTNVRHLKLLIPRTLQLQLMQLMQLMLLMLLIAATSAGTDAVYAVVSAQTSLDAAFSQLQMLNISTLQVKRCPFEIRMDKGNCAEHMHCGRVC
jgi:hypothetical protein